MNLIANGLKSNKTFMSKFFAELDAINAKMPKTYGFGTHIPVEQYDDETPITVQTKEDGIVTHCNHAGAYRGLFFSDAFYKDRIIEMPHHALLCDKCNAWQDEEGDWHE